MRSIDITEADFIRLQKLAIPFVDTTPASVISRLLDAHENEAAPTYKQAPSPNIYSAGNIPSLVHTKLMDARFDGNSPNKTNWDAFVRLALQTVFKKFKSVQDLRRISGANVVEGKKEDEGYKFVPLEGFSYQGVSAEDAADIISRCARGLNCTTSFEFAWRDKEGAFKPGERALVNI